MGYKNLLVDRQGSLLIVTFNRPEVLNALNGDTLDDLNRFLDELENDEQTRVVILTGAGEKAFVAGADISELAACDETSGYETARRGQGVFSRIEASSKVFIAAINGFALGGGCEISISCDIRLASETARLGQPEVKLGIIPGYGGTQRLLRLVGLGKARQLIYSGGMIGAAEAHRIGLVDEVYPPGDLREKAIALAREIAAQGPLAVAESKRLTQLGPDTTLAEGLEAEARAFGRICGTADMKEGTRAFLEKRAAKFEGK